MAAIRLAAKRGPGHSLTAGLAAAAAVSHRYDRLRTGAAQPDDAGRSCRCAGECCNQRSHAPCRPAAPPASPQGLAGMLTVTAPVPLRVFLKGRLVGTTEAESTMLPQGTHELEFVNEAVGFRARRTVSIKPGVDRAP